MDSVMINYERGQASYGRVRRVAGPLIVADNMRGTSMYEVVYIGHHNLVGEIIRLSGDDAFIQVYEDTSGLTVGEEVKCSGEPLSVELGPGLLDSIYDGIQRPLDMIAITSQSQFIPRGASLPALKRDKKWKFIPEASIKIGCLLSGGDIIGNVKENNLMINHKILIPPNVCGELQELVLDGEYTVCDVIAVLKDNDKLINVYLSHKWPVRDRRPYVEKIPGNYPLLTGQRVLDCMFPAIQGATCAIPGAFGCGKTCVSQALSKHSNSDVIIYVGCGERGNEMAEVLREFPELTINVNGQEESIMQRTCLIANTSNMPVPAREASIYTGITIAEYYRDMGYHVAMIGDSTSRWAEALREISGRLGEMPADSGYPAYLAARLAAFYERAGRIVACGAPKREGSATLVGAVSPPGGDFTDPVTTATMGIVQVFWGLDRKLAQRKHFPSVNWITSFSKYKEQLYPFFSKYDPNFEEYQKTMLNILQNEQELMEIVQIVGRDSLAEDQKATLDFADMVKSDFLQQNAFTDYDYTCPPVKAVGLMRNIIVLYQQTMRLLTETSDSKILWSTIKTTLSSTLAKIVQAKFLSPHMNEDEMMIEFNKIRNEIIEKTTQFGD